MNLRASLLAQMQESIALKTRLCADTILLDGIEQAISVLTDCYFAGGKLLIAGNGGSAADAQHMAAELVCRYKRERPGLPAIALSTDTSAVTAWSNDYEYASYFTRSVQAFGKPGDVFLGITTSGTSRNIVLATKQARALGLRTIGLLGRTGGDMKEIVDVPLVVPHTDTARIQEAHIMLIHLLCEEVEKSWALAQGPR